MIALDESRVLEGEGSCGTQEGESKILRSWGETEKEKNEKESFVTRCPAESGFDTDYRTCADEFLNFTAAV